MVVENRFAMNIEDDKLQPSSESDFRMYAEITSAAISHARALYSVVFANTEFVKELPLLQTREEILENVRNAVFSVLN